MLLHRLGALLAGTLLVGLLAVTAAPAGEPPVGGEALMHTADTVFLIEQMSLGSKEIAEFWGGKYRDTIEVINAIKSVTTPVLPYPIRVEREAGTGILVPHPLQPKDYPILPPE